MSFWCTSDRFEKSFMVIVDVRWSAIDRWYSLNTFPRCTFWTLILFKHRPGRFQDDQIKVSVPVNPINVRKGKPWEGVASEVNGETRVRCIGILFAGEYEIDILGDPTRGTRHQWTYQRTVSISYEIGIAFSHPVSLQFFSLYNVRFQDFGDNNSGSKIVSGLGQSRGWGILCNRRVASVARFSIVSC